MTGRSVNPCQPAEADRDPAGFRAQFLWPAAWGTLLPRSFYEPGAEVVAPRLLGHLLLSRSGSGWCGGVIVETEAYLSLDPACHGFKRQTPRNRSMYGPPGHAYVYFIYGNHWCFNAVCAPAGVPEAVLIRAIEPAIGSDRMRRRRPVPGPFALTNGPAKLCAALGIDRTFDEADLTVAGSPVVILANPGRADLLRSAGPVVTTTRVGISKAADLPLRFYLDRSRYVSRRGIPVHAPTLGAAS